MTPFSSHEDDGLFLPYFCHIQTIFVVVLIGEILAILLTLAGAGSLLNGLSYLALVSLFIQWIGLSCCIILCLVRPKLKRYSQKRAGLIAFLVILLITAIISELAFTIMQSRGNIDSDHLASRGHFLFSNLCIAALVSALALRYFYIQYHWKRQIQAESEARVQALQSRIRPHFLFNSMNIIASLTRTQPELAEEVVEDLSDLFRASLAGKKNLTTWREEITLVKQYLRIEALRLGDRLTIDWRIDAIPEDALVPTLTLQPLLENAIYHGIEPLPEGGVVSITATRADKQLSILIENPVINQAKPKHVGNQIALENVRQRMTIFFQGKGALNAKAGEGNYRVTLTFPYENLR